MIKCECQLKDIEETEERGQDEPLVNYFYTKKFWAFENGEYTK